MNFATFERAQVAAYAYRIARRSGSLDCIRAVCYVFRNRLKAGWGDGTWTWLIENAKECDGNAQPPTFAVPMSELDPQDRLLQLIVRDIDDIYLGNSDDDTKAVVQDALYFQFVDLPPNPWFVDNVVRMHDEHPRIGQIGMIALYR